VATASPQPVSPPSLPTATPPAPPGPSTLTQQLLGRGASAVCLAAAAVAALILHAAGSGPLGWCVYGLTLALTGWWSAPRATAPGRAARAFFAVAAAALAATAPADAAWPLPATALGLSIPLLPAGQGERFAGLVGVLALCGTVVGTWAALPGHTGAPYAQALVTVALGLGLGTAVGLWQRERRAHRIDADALLWARYQAETLGEHLRFLEAQGFPGAGGRWPQGRPPGPAPAGGDPAAAGTPPPR
jgi:hypothetical protein